MRNKFEEAVAKQLKRRRKDFSYESLRIPYVLFRNYIPDFIIRLDGGSRQLFIECKGYLRVEDKAKLRAVRKQHPDKDIRLLFDSERNFNRNTKWCTKHGFPHAWGIIPEDWLI
jgi:hypothetical protein